MVFLVPYDGSPVSEAALDRAVEHGKALEKEVVAVTFIPTGAEYAERRKWIQPQEDFAIDSARAELKRKIDETTDESERNFLDSGATVENGVGGHIRQAAHEVEASAVYVGAAEQEGTDYRTPFGEITTDETYDLHLVRSY
ncbi:universal stress protein [Halovenus salina]|uniref:Universal stress protein n=1 Tax=Halovenus salina TaxID=1510225 RepID=A0ABD5VZR9_9EURY|nr:universal stress protein [Halovenus salina]